MNASPISVVSTLELEMVLADSELHLNLHEDVEVRLSKSSVS